MRSLKTMVVGLAVCATLSALVLAQGAATISATESATLKQIYEKEMQNYQGFALLPGTTKLMDKLDGPHSGYITVYVNEIARKAIESDAKTIPDGGLIIKDIYNAEHKHHSCAVMKKIAGEWHFGGFYPLYQPYKFGKDAGSSAKSCVDCHAHATRDKVYLWRSK